MREIIQWLLKIESIAGKCYFDAAAHFENDEKLREFLLHSAEDEAMHFHVMGSALTAIAKTSIAAPIIAVDSETKGQTERPFIKLAHQLQTDRVTEESLIDCIIDSEYSEWNDIFLFVVNTLQERFREFYFAAAKIQSHMRYIQYFLDSHPYGKQQVLSLHGIHKVFQENILIVEDDPAISKFLCAILKNEGHIDVAQNGRDGLDRLKQKYYKLILSDVDMPIMDGIEFFTKATAAFPATTNRFLFFTGSASEERAAFFDQYRIPYLTKPAPLKQLRDMAVTLLHDIPK